MLNLFFVKGYTMDLLQKYEELAKQLGDVTYKLLALQNKQQELLKEIKNLAFLKYVSIKYLKYLYLLREISSMPSNFSVLNLLKQKRFFKN